MQIGEKRHQMIPTIPVGYDDRNLHKNQTRIRFAIRVKNESRTNTNPSYSESSEFLVGPMGKISNISAYLFTQMTTKIEHEEKRYSQGMSLSRARPNKNQIEKKNYKTKNDATRLDE